MTYTCGEGDTVLFLLSGGPGCPSDYLRNGHLRYAQKGYRVIAWDPSGTGESSRHEDHELWSIDYFVEEAEAIRAALDCGAVHMLGHSWGGVQALEYYLKYSQNIKTLSFISTAFNLPMMQRGFERMKQTLGSATMRMMARREANGTTEHPEYQAVFTLLFYRHFCRMENPPKEVTEMDIRQAMLGKVFGRYLFNCTGTERGYDRTGDLHRVKAPALILHGEHDFIPAECATLSRDYLPNAKLHVLEQTAHYPFYEEPVRYHALLSSFLETHKKAQTY